MITAVFKLSGKKFVGFSLKGHADMAESGKDVLCAAVSGAAQCVNAVIEDALGLEGSFSVKEGEDNLLECDISAFDKLPESACKVLEGFALTLEMWEKDFPQNIQVKKITI